MQADLLMPAVAHSDSQRRVCVFCGSSNGANAVYRDEARALGRLLAEAGMGIIYGGAHVGLMGALADAALAAGGEVIGVIPHGLEMRELAHQGLTELHVVVSMHARKALMAERTDAFIAMPGGMGTLDEFFEIVTWAQLGIHAKPCILVNTQGYYDALLQFLNTALAEGFVNARNRALILTVADATEAVSAIRNAISE